MYFKTKTSLTLSAAALFFMSACGGDSSSKSTEVSDDVITDTTTVPLPDTLQTDTSSTLPDTTATDSTTTNTTVRESKVVMPEEATNITPAITIPKEEGIGLLIDDFEDGDNQSLQGEYYWYTYDDNNGGADGDGASEIKTPLNDDGYPKARKSDDGTDYVWAVYFALDKGEYAWDPYVGWGVILDSEVDYSRFGGITYWYKGSAHEVHIETSDVIDYDVHLAKVKAAKTWTKAVIRFKDLTQGGWGEKVKFDAAHIEKISFQAKGDKKIDSLLSAGYQRSRKRQG